jgi:hypothetical protein
MAAGSIVIDLLLRTGSFQTDTDRASKKLKAFEKDLTKLGTSIGRGIATAAAIGATAITGLALAFDSLVKGVADFQDIEEVTGGAAEGFASLALAAAGAGVSMESITDASVRLTKGLVGVDDDSKAAGAALKALNINIADFKKLDPAAQYEAVGKALQGYADGAGKTAVAVALFGKSGAEQLKVFKQLEEQGGRTAILTREQIQLADKYADAQAVSAAKLKLYAQVVAVQALPAVTALQGVLIDLLKSFVDTSTATDKLTKSNAVSSWAESAALAIAAFVDDLRVASSEIRAFAASTEREFANIKFGGKLLTASPSELGDLVLRQKGPLQEALNERNKIADDADKVFEENAKKNGTKIQDALRKQFAQQKLGLTGERLDATTDPRSLVFGKGLPQVNFKGAAKDPAASKDDPTRKLLENDLKAIENLVKREQDILSSRNKFLDIFNDQGLLSIRSYYDAQRVILESATSAQIALYDREIAALRDYQNKKTTSKKDSADAQGKINELLEKQVRLEQEAGQKGIELGIKQAQAQRDLAREVSNVNVQLLEMQGRFAEAADIRFRQQNAALVLRLEVEGDQEALDKIEKLRRAAVDQAKFTEEAISSDRALQRLGITSETIALKQQTGALTELGALRELGVARQASIAELEGIVAAQEKIAAASGDDGLILQAQRARLELEKLKAIADPLGQKFTELFEDSFADNFAAFANGTKTAKQAFRDFANSITTEVNRILAKDFAKSLFGEGGVFGGAGKGLGDIFSPKAFGQRLAGPGPETGAGESGGVPNDIFKDLGIPAQTQAIRTNTVTVTDLTTAQKTATTTIRSSSESTVFSFNALTEAANAAAFALNSIKPAGSSGGLFGDLGEIFKPEGDFSIGDVGLSTGDFDVPGFELPDGFLGQSAPSGEASIAAMFKSGTTEAASAAELFALEAGTATTATAGLGSAVGAASLALGGMPAIIAGIGALLTATSGQVGGALGLLQSGAVDKPGGLFGLFGNLFGGSGGAGGFFGSLFGFADGGYTGPGGKRDPAGVVHKGEVVWSQSDVMRAGGPEVVDAMRRGLRGYADGGIVPQTYGLPPPVTNNNRSSRGGDTFSITIPVQGSVDRQTREQIASDVARQVQIARSRNTAGVTR